MGKFDFVVKWDPEKESQLQLFDKILYSIVVKEIKANKPVPWFFGGDSGEGKSETTLYIMWRLCVMQGLDFAPIFNELNIYTPLQYPKKINALMYNPVLKKHNMIALHEARAIVSAKQWYNFVNQAIGDINATSRSIKRICIMIVSQFIRDISKDIRYTLKYYSTISRPKGKPARLKIWVMWKDDRDLENPKLRKRKLRGLIIDKSGKYNIFVPEYFEMPRIDKELIKQFEQSDLESKEIIFKQRIDRLIKDLSQDLDLESKKITSMVGHYVNNPDSLLNIGHRRGEKWVLNKSTVCNMHELTPMEFKQFRARLNKELKEKGVLDDGKES